MHVYQHAIQRFQERVAPVTADEAKAEILRHEKAILAAAKFGAPIVKLPGRVRLILDGENVVTVYGRDMLPRQCRRNSAS